VSCFANILFLYCCCYPAAAILHAAPHCVTPAADAGADYSSYINEDTEYDLVQTAANNGQFEAVVKLVEAGASWRLQRGQQRVVGGCVNYVPEMLCINKPGLKVRMNCKQSIRFGIGSAPQGCRK
jgi:hypothetical protein